MKKILIIDDDEGILGAVRAILEFAEFEVITANDYSIINNLNNEDLPDLNLLDLLLSGQDGKRIAQKLKKDSKTKHIPIIMLSAHPDASIAAKEAGADDFLAKPFDMEKLLQKIQKYSK